MYPELGESPSDFNKIDKFMYMGKFDLIKDMEFSKANIYNLSDEDANVDDKGNLTLLKEIDSEEKRKINAFKYKGKYYSNGDRYFEIEKKNKMVFKYSGEIDFYNEEEKKLYFNNLEELIKITGNTDSFVHDKSMNILPIYEIITDISHYSYINDNKVKLVNISDITPGRSESEILHSTEQNERTTSIINAIKENKILPPVKLNILNEIQDGNHRYWVSKKMGKTTIPSIYV